MKTIITIALLLVTSSIFGQKKSDTANYPNYLSRPAKARIFSLQVEDTPSMYVSNKILLVIRRRQTGEDLPLEDRCVLQVLFPDSTVIIKDSAQAIIRLLESLDDKVSENKRLYKQVQTFIQEINNFGRGKLSWDVMINKFDIMLEEEPPALKHSYKLKTRQ
ncbi:MAG: hypothetical protein KF862_07490 [Chitinophagaceae bacterium]|nr:hypothetical protein [Chitinophagaceae bacterium]